MRSMRYWSVTVSADRYGAERLYDHDVLELAVPEGARPGDQVALVAAVEPPMVFALGEVRSVRPEIGADEPDPIEDEPGAVIAYTRRCFDQLIPADGLIPVASAGEHATSVEAEAFRALSERLPRAAGARRSWLVSVDLPIEAATPADAVRQYWSYLRELGPQELPAYVSPTENQLAMQAFVFGDEANQGPEESDD